jgi:hypothetical protein
VATLTFAGGAWAKDALKTTVEANGFTFEQNGNPLAAGTYAVGTLKVYMVVVGTQWPESLSPVELDLAVEERKSNPATRYPVPIRLRQAGSGLLLTPTPAEHWIEDAAWTGSSSIVVSVPQSTIDDPAMNADGTQLVANLHAETTANRSGLDTVTTVKIIATLVHPDEAACLKTATFVSDNALSRNLSTAAGGLDFTYGYNKNNGSFNWSVTPQNTQLRDHVIVVNTCATEQYYDARIGLPAGIKKPEPGNVVDSFVSTNANAADFPFSNAFSELTAAIADGDFPADGTGAGTSLCVQSNTLAGQHSQWLRARVELVTTGFTSAAGIPAADATQPHYTPFTSDLSEPNTACTGTHSSSAGQGTAGVYVRSKSCTEQGATVCAYPSP